MKNTAITKDVQEALTPNRVLQDLLEGNNRFVNGSSEGADNSALVSQTNWRTISKSSSTILYRLSCSCRNCVRSGYR